MKKLFLIFSLVYAGIAHAEDQLSKAIRESNVEKVKELVGGINSTQLPYYCSLADEIVIMNREKYTNGEFLRAVDKMPSSDFEMPKKLWYAGFLCIATFGYGFYQHFKADSIRSEAYKSFPRNDELYQMSERMDSQGLKMVLGSSVVLIGLGAYVNRLAIEYLKQNHENALAVKEILEKKKWGFEG